MSIIDGLIFVDRYLLTPAIMFPLKLLPLFRTFRIINPTKNPFFFSWAQSVTETEAVSSNEFRCLKKSGQILVGKSIDVSLKFVDSEEHKR